MINKQHRKRDFLHNIEYILTSLEHLRKKKKKFQTTKNDSILTVCYFTYRNFPYKLSKTVCIYGDFGCGVHSITCIGNRREKRE